MTSAGPSVPAAPPPDIARPRRLLANIVADLPPASFAMVMGTGIVSIACQVTGHDRLALLLFALNGVFFVTLWVLTIARLVLHLDRVLADLKRHASSVGYFTIVVGTSVVGVQLFSLAGDRTLAAGLWLLAVALWVIVTYSVFTAIIIAPRKPPLRRGLNGLWLLASVATQAIAVLGAMVAPEFGAQREIVLFVSLVSFMMGCMLYIILISMIFFRLTFVPLAPGEMAPPYWINMGATTIATQAGATLLLHGDGAPVLVALEPFLRGFTLFFWAAGTWWIPLLLALAVWAHVVGRAPLRYSPQSWGLVFPLGMYTACTDQLARANGFDFLLAVPPYAVFVALAAWAFTFAGWLRQAGTLVGVGGRAQAGASPSGA